MNMRQLLVEKHWLFLILIFNNYYLSGNSVSGLGLKLQSIL